MDVIGIDADKDKHLDSTASRLWLRSRAYCQDSGILWATADNDMFLDADRDDQRAGLRNACFNNQGRAENQGSFNSFKERIRPIGDTLGDLSLVEGKCRFFEHEVIASG